jgi:hypothetical protein
MPRRQADAKAHPELAVGPDEAPTGGDLAKRLLAAGQTELKEAERTWRGIALLQGAALRGAGSEPGKKARQLLKDVLDDETVLPRIGEQGAKDEQLALSAQARALERFGLTSKAIEAWALLAKNYPDTVVGRDAQEQIRRLGSEKLPPAYLGLGVDGTAIDQLAPQGPAAKAGLKVGDVLTKVGDQKIASTDDLRAAMQKLKPGQRVQIEVLRDERRVVITVEVGKRPAPSQP